MNEKELNKVLRDRARKLGLCDQWYDAWGKRESQQELIDKYIKGIDFCIKHDYPKIDFIKAYFPNELLLENGIFVDEKIGSENLNTAVLLGGSSGSIIYNGQVVGNVYMRHQSKLNVIATDGAKVFIETYEGTRLKVFADDISKVFVYQHGGTVDASGNVTVRDKRKAVG